MGADKNSSPKTELGLYPKFATKDSHRSLPTSRSHSGPTNPRNKPQTIPKWKHDSRSKGHSNPAQCQANCPQAPGELSASPRRTVREVAADCPKMIANLQYCTNNNGLSAEAPRTVRDRHTPRGLSTDRRQTVRQTPYN
jgi:hypothetical protein